MFLKTQLVRQAELLLASEGLWKDCMCKGDVSVTQCYRGTLVCTVCQACTSFSRMFFLPCLQNSSNSITVVRIFWNEVPRHFIIELGKKFKRRICKQVILKYTAS